VPHDADSRRSASLSTVARKADGGAGFEVSQPQRDALSHK